MSYTFGRSNSSQSTTDNRNWSPAIITNSLCTPKAVDVRGVNQFYDHVEAHLNGVAKVLKPMLEINNIILDGCRVSKSAGHNFRGQLKQCDTELSYYTPQKLKYGKTTSSDQRQCCKCDENFSGKKLTSDNSYNRSLNKSTLRPLSESTSKTTLSISKKDNICSKASSSRLSTSTENKSQRHHEKSNDTFQEHILKNCSMCGINIQKVKVLALIPCKHLFCYPCMSHSELNACPKCWKPLKRETIKNITSK